MNVLIVDDEIDIGVLVSGILRQTGHSSKYVTSLRAANERIHTSTFQLFFVDVNLPDGSGYDFIQPILNKNPKAIIIMISAYNGNPEVEKTKKYGAHRFIKKPFTKRQILKAVDDLT